MCLHGAPCEWRQSSRCGLNSTRPLSAVTRPLQDTEEDARAAPERGEGVRCECERCLTSGRGARHDRLEQFFWSTLVCGHGQHAGALSAAEPCVGAALEQQRGGLELFVMQRDMQCAPAGGPAWEGGSSIHRVDVSAGVEEGAHHIGPVGRLALAMVRPQRVSATGSPVQRGVVASVVFVGVGAGGNELSNPVDIALMCSARQWRARFLNERRASGQRETDRREDSFANHGTTSISRVDSVDDRAQALDGVVHDLPAGVMMTAE